MQRSNWHLLQPDVLWIRSIRLCNVMIIWYGMTYEVIFYVLAACLAEGTWQRKVDRAVLMLWPTGPALPAAHCCQVEWLQLEWSGVEWRVYTKHHWPRTHPNNVQHLSHIYYCGHNICWLITREWDILIHSYVHPCLYRHTAALLLDEWGLDCMPVYGRPLTYMCSSDLNIIDTRLSHPWTHRTEYC